MSRAQTSKIPLREVYVLREVKVDIKKLRRGDVYRMAKSNKDDVVDEKEYYLCTKKPEKVPPAGNYLLEGQVLIPPSVGKACRFTWGKGIKNE